jgi:hypothetical protein
MTRSAELAAMHVHRDELTYLFRLADREIPVTLPLQPHTAHALRHLYALHAARTPCHAAPDSSAAAELLLRTASALGAVRCCITVRPHPEPAFWLTIDDGRTSHDLDLDVLDTAAVLLSRRVPITVVETSDTDWDLALQALLR